jgi:hypothetical protein
MSVFVQRNPSMPDFLISYVAKPSPMFFFEGHWGENPHLNFLIYIYEQAQNGLGRDLHGGG